MTNKRITFPISEGTHQVLRMASAALDMTQQEFIENAILEKGERANREVAASQKAFAALVAKSKGA